MDCNTQEKIAKWLASPFLKVDPQAWKEVGKAAFTLAAMVHVAGKGKATKGLYYGRPSKLAKLLNSDVRRIREHREKLRQHGYLKPLAKKRGAFRCDQLTEKTLAPLHDEKRWVRVPTILTEQEGHKPSAALMVLGGLLSRGECLDKCREDMDWTYQHGPQYDAVIPSATALAERCGVAPNTVTQELGRLQSEGLLDVQQRPRTAEGKFVRHRIAFTDWPEPQPEQEAPTIPMAHHIIPKVALPAGYKLPASLVSPVTADARFVGRRHPELVASDLQSSGGGVAPLPLAQSVSGHAESVTVEPFAKTAASVRTNGPSRSQERSKPFAETVPPSKEAFLGGLSKRLPDNRLCDAGTRSSTALVESPLGKLEEDSRKAADASSTTATSTTPPTTPQDAPRKPLRTRQEILAADPAELLTAPVDASQEAAAREALLAQLAALEAA